MPDLILQNPLVSFLLFLIPIIGGTWKILDILFVKPRDFRIAVLEKNVEEIRKELQRTSKSDALPTPDAVVSTVASDVKEVPRIESSQTPLESATLLNSMNAFIEAWEDKALTELQRDQFEKNYLGQKVVWRARLGGVSEKENGFIWVSLNSENERNYGLHAIAVFDLKYKEALLMVNKGEIVTVSGVLDSFLLSPLLKDCAIVRNI